MMMGLTVDGGSDTGDETSVDVLGVDHARELLDFLFRERLEEVLPRIFCPRLGIGSNVRSIGLSHLISIVSHSL